MRNNFLNKTFHFSFSTFNFVLDCLFPKNCVGCQKEGKWICNKCYDKIVFVKKTTCPKCNKLTENGKFCTNCRNQTNLTGLITAAYYEDGPLKEAIHNFKYNGIFDLAEDLSKILFSAIPKDKRFQNMVIIPVPLHKKRKVYRGYNQSELLSLELKKLTGLKVVNNKLVRHIFTKKTQVELSGKARRENLKNCFSWIGKNNELNNNKVFLVDDIYTTGATLEECAKVLRKVNCREVWGLVLAKA